MTATSRTATAEGEERIPLRVQLSVNFCGIFSNGAINISSVVVPLWVLQIDPSPLTIGIVMASPHVLPVLLAIHGGSLMDRIGIRKVMIAFATMGAIAPFLYPVLPVIGLIILLQMLTGVSTSMCWIGTQAQIGALLRGSPTQAGRVTFFNRFAILVGPPAAGLAWDLGGPWGGFGFIGFWGIALLVSCLVMPAAAEEQSHLYEEKAKFVLRDILPRLSDYVDAVKLMAAPAIAFVVAATLLRHATQGVQTSFYVVWLEQTGLSATLIGLLISSSSILGGIGSLSAGWLARLFSSYRTLVFCICLSIITIAITPLLGSFVLLLIASSLRGGFMGVSQPLLISLMAQSAGKAQGKGAGLRTTANRLAVLIVPIFMGAVAEWLGIEMSFYAIGVLLVAMIVVLAVKARPAFEPRNAAPVQARESL